MKHFKNANDIDYIINDIENNAKKMQLILDETLNNFNDAIDDYHKLYLFNTLQTFTDILFDYVVKIVEDGDKLSNEYNLLWKMMKTAEEKLNKKEKNNASKN